MRPSWHYQPTHNVFLLIWAEVGILGLLAIAVLFFIIIKKFIIHDDWQALPVLLALIVIMLVDHWLWSLHFGVLFFWLVLGMIIKLQKDKCLIIDHK